jgi:hypothetical protein
MVRDSPNHGKWIKNFSKKFKKEQTAPLIISMLIAVEKSPIDASHWSIDTVLK